MAKNQSLAVSTLEFWEEFYNTITSRLDNLSELQHLFQQFVDMTQIMLKSAEKMQGLDYDNLDNEEIEEQEAEIKGISTIAFREYA